MAEWPRSGPYLRALAEWGFDSRLATRFAILGRNLFASPGTRERFLYYCGVVIIFLSLFSRNWELDVSSETLWRSSGPSHVSWSCWELATASCLSPLLDLPALRPLRPYAGRHPRARTPLARSPTITRFKAPLPVEPRPDFLPTTPGAPALCHHLRQHSMVFCKLEERCRSLVLVMVLDRV
jgi:hypothetical protein